MRFPVVLLIAACACTDVTEVAQRIVAPGTPSVELAADANSATWAVATLPDIPGAYWSGALAINAAGDAAGYVSLSPTLTHAVRWTHSGYTDLGLPCGTESFASDINDAGTVVGSCGNGPSNGVMWTVLGTKVVVPPSNARNLGFEAVNNSEIAVGNMTIRGPGGAVHAIRYSNATGVVDLHPPGANYVDSDARSINDQGVIVGYVTLPSLARHVAMWSATNVFTDLGSLGGNGDALGVNNAGTVVGWSEDIGSTTRPFVWQPTTGMVAGPVDGQASAISDRGRIVGHQHFYGLPAIPMTKRGVGPVITLPFLAGGQEARPAGVNSCGTIVGQSAIANGTFRAVRWTKPGCD